MHFEFLSIILNKILSSIIASLKFCADGASMSLPTTKCSECERGKPHGRVLVTRRQVSDAHRPTRRNLRVTDLMRYLKPVDPSRLRIKFCMEPGVTGRYDKSERWTRERITQIKLQQLSYRPPAISTHCPHLPEFLMDQFRRSSASCCFRSSRAESAFPRLPVEYCNHPAVKCARRETQFCLSISLPAST